MLQSWQHDSSISSQNILKAQCAYPHLIYFSLLVIHNLSFINTITICEFKMDNNQKASSHKQSPSKDRPTSSKVGGVRKGSFMDGDMSQLKELKEKGKRVLKGLIPQPIIMIKKQVQKGADYLKREILPHQKLLPTLTIKNISTELFDRNYSQQSNFQQMNQQLTHSMIFFHKTVNGPAQDGEILRLQTQKCYRKIPRCYFEQQMSNDSITILLTKQKTRTSEKKDELCDYFDEVEFNVNQQVAYKMKVFMTFVTYLTSIGTLADLSVNKIRGTRIKNNVLRQIVVQRAQKVNYLRNKKQNIEKCLETLQRIKKWRKLQNFLLSQIQVKGRITATQVYYDYCIIHEKVKDYCCPRMLCKYWDIAYYIGKGYQQSFSRSLKNYLLQIIILDEKQLQQILQPSKLPFVTTNPLRAGGIVDTSMDESYEVEEQVELINKHNIERQIVSIFQQGMHKCNYDTGDICEEIKLAIRICQNRLYMMVKGQQNILQVIQYSKKEKIMALQKLTITKFIKTVELWSERLTKIIKRQTAIVEKALRAARQLQKDSPDKQQIISSFLMQILDITLMCIDQSLSFMVTSRKLKQQQMESIRQLLLIGKQWKILILDLKHYPGIWSHYNQNYANSQNENIDLKIIESRLGNLVVSRKKIVQIMVNSYNTSAIQKLPQRLQQDDWIPVSFPGKFHNTLGEVIYGPAFTKFVQSNQRKLLSSSLLLDKSILLQKTASIRDSFMNIHEEGRRDGSNQSIGQFQLHLSQNMVNLEGQNFKLVNSTLAVVDFLHGYLQWVEEVGGEGQLLESTILSKIMEFILMYNTHIKDLILNKEALKYAKIKSQSITGKHLLLAYSQLKFFKSIVFLITKRFPPFTELANILKISLQKVMNQISKKFRTILQLSISQSINKLVVDPRKQIKWPVNQSIEIVTALSRSCEYVRDILMSNKQFPQFISVNWCSMYVQKIKTLYKSVYKMIMSSSGSRKSKDIDWNDNLYWKFKQLDYVAQNLSEWIDYIPGFDLILTQIEAERKKLECPH